VLELIINCSFLASHFFPAYIWQTKSSGEFGTPHFFAGLSANKNLAVNLANGSSRGV